MWMHAVRAVCFVVGLCHLAARAEEPPQVEAPAKPWKRFGGPEFRAPATVATLEFLPDGRTLCGGTALGLLVTWDAQTGAQVAAPAALGGPARLSPDGTSALGLEAGAVCVFRVAGRERIVTLEGEASSLDEVSWSPDGEHVAAIVGAASRAGEQAWEARVWVRASGRLAMRAPASAGSLLAWSSDGGRVAYVSERQEVDVVDRAGWRARERVAVPGEGTVKAVLTPAGDTVLAVRPTGGSVVWTVGQGSTRDDLARAVAGSGSLALSRDGSKVAVSGADSTRVLSFASGAVLADLGPGTGRRTEIAFSPDGRFLAMGEGCGVRVWDLEQRKELSSTPAGFRPVLGLSWLPDGSAIVAPGTGDRVVLWPLSGEAPRVLGQVAGPLFTLSVSRDGALLAAGSAESQVRVLGIDTARPTREWQDPGGADQAAWFPFDDHVLAIAGAKGVRFVDVDTRDLVARLDTGLAPLHVRAARGADLVAAISLDDACVWTWPGCVEGIRTFAAAGVDFLGGDLSPDGRALALLSSNGVLDLLETPSTRPLWSVRLSPDSDPEEPGARVQFTRDGWLLGCLARPETLLFFDRLTGATIRSLAAPAGSAIRSFEVSPDGKNVAAGLHDGSVLLYTLSPGARPGPCDPGLLSNELASGDPHVAWQAVWDLAAAAPGAAKAVVAGLLTSRPTAGLDALIRDLDADDPAARDCASRALLEAGMDAEAALEGALKTSVSPEQRGRLAQLCAQVKGLLPGAASSRRVIRTVAALELRGDDLAGTLLSSMADGHTASLARFEARAALVRLRDRRP